MSGTADQASPDIDEEIVVSTNPFHSQQQSPDARERLLDLALRCFVLVACVGKAVPNGCRWLAQILAYLHWHPIEACGERRQGWS